MTTQTIPTKTRRPRESWSRRLLRKALSRVEYGVLELRDGDEVLRFEGPRPGPLARAFIKDPEVYERVLFGGTCGAGEAYRDGQWSSDDLVSVIRFFAVNDRAHRGLLSRLGSLRRLADTLRHWLRRNTRAGSKRNIAEHYDLGNDFYRLFLDPTMAYSSAVFEADDASLEEASRAKFERLCRRLQLRPEDHLLDLGCGWGGLAIHAARRYGCRVTAATISKAQYELAAERIAAAGLGERIDLELIDYRDLSGRYSKIVSVEMIEAVGHEYLPAFFRRLEELLAPGGLIALQAITLPDHHYPWSRKRSDFISKHIFPGCQVPSLAAMSQAWSRSTRLGLLGQEELGDHYAETLRRWRAAFLDRRDEVRALGYPERFIRLWDYYLALCQGGFAERALGLSQLVLGGPGSPRPRELASVSCPTAR